MNKRKKERKSIPFSLTSLYSSIQYPKGNMKVVEVKSMKGKRQLPLASNSANRVSIPYYRTPRILLYLLLSSSPPLQPTTASTRKSQRQWLMVPSRPRSTPPSSPRNPSSLP
ncbi:hypothetical protein F2P56_009604 [Juglans regia]|uniref:Uncharacterized protein n=1 Tax=Juglans regia TaxID=51240 RepID=A0A833XWT9_JUGRE|nr:hypothetical protein F2P56_009604 [Juglans regia]